MSGRSSVFNSFTKANAGVIVSCRSASGRLATYHREGRTVLAGLRAIVDILDARTDGPWTITAISTPETILRDVIGRGMTPEDETTPQLAEPRYLGAIHRLDLLAVPLRGRGKTSVREYREKGVR